MQREPGQRRMQPRQLKGLIMTGHYAPEPSLVAEAMLRRRGVRLLLVDSPARSAAGRTLSSAQSIRLQS
jgi:hypothetical protein